MPSFQQGFSLSCGYKRNWFQPPKRCLSLEAGCCSNSVSRSDELYPPHSASCLEILFQPTHRPRPWVPHMGLQSSDGGASLAIHWWRLRASTAGARFQSLVEELESPHVACRSKKRKREKERNPVMSGVAEDRRDWEEGSPLAAGCGGRWCHTTDPHWAFWPPKLGRTPSYWFKPSAKR